MEYILGITLSSLGYRPPPHIPSLWIRTWPLNISVSVSYGLLSLLRTNLPPCFFSACKIIHKSPPLLRSLLLYYYPLLRLATCCPNPRTQPTKTPQHTAHFPTYTYLPKSHWVALLPWLLAPSLSKNRNIINILLVLLSNYEISNTH